MARDTLTGQSLGGTLLGYVKKARVLMVGAGGIGCELLKNLVLTGFGEIHVVDLDTIDLSNLNRQFLFRSEHIKKPKALVAKESAGKFNPNVKIEAYHDNIKDSRFNIAWFKGFDIVFNALDNLAARQHVNRMCLAARIPLIESGTTGFNGQVQVIKKGETECYDCTPKDPPKSFPVCTIRSTPSQPIHCIVWGKSYLFAEIFGTSEDDAPDVDHKEDEDNAEEVANLRKEAQALKRIRTSMGSEDFPRLVFDKVFKEDIERLRSVWQKERPPEALNYEALSQEALGVGAGIAQRDQVVWSPAENFTVFVDSLKRLSNRLEEIRASSDVGNAAPVLTFDKDDEDILDFVAASANLRSHIFGIETRSKFDIKQMAGNIIPAIATTNAMIAGLCVLQAFKVMRSQLDKAKMVFLTRGTERVISSEPLRLPNKVCDTCSAEYTSVIVNIKRTTVQDFVNFLKKRLGYGDEFSVQRDETVIYDVEEDIHLYKTFEEVGLLADTFITVKDEAEEFTKVNVIFHVDQQDLPADASPVEMPRDGFIIPRTHESLLPTPTTNGHALANGSANGTAAGAVDAKAKRKADEAGLEDELVKKKGKVMAQPFEKKDEVVLVEDDGAIVIDDD